MANRDSFAPGICPGCRLISRVVFGSETAAEESEPYASGEDLADALVSCVDDGANILNVSVGLVRAYSRTVSITEALNYALRRGVVVIAAAENRKVVGSSPITRHPWVIPTTAFSSTGTPMVAGAIGRSIGSHGLGAPGKDILSLTPGGGMGRASGSSIATAFVSGATALVWSLVPHAPAAAIRRSMTRAEGSRRAQLIPPMLDAMSSYRMARRVGQDTT